MCLLGLCCVHQTTYAIQSKHLMLRYSVFVVKKKNQTNKHFTALFNFCANPTWNITNVITPWEKLGYVHVVKKKFSSILLIKSSSTLAQE